MANMRAPKSPQEQIDSLMHAMSNFLDNPPSDANMEQHRAERRLRERASPYHNANSHEDICRIAESYKSI